jgi:putative membrane protein
MGVTMAQPSGPGSEVVTTPTAADSVSGILPAAAEPATGLVDVTGMDDAQVAGTLAALCSRATRVGQLGESKSTRRDVKQLAHEIAASSLDSDERLAALLAERGVVQRESPASAEVRRDAFRSVTSLLMVTGKDFDRTYMDEQLVEADKAIAVIDRILPEAQSPELTAQLQRVRSKAAWRARTIRAMRGPSGSSL